jgi:predicted O-methyltransferase YrrM
MSRWLQNLVRIPSRVRSSLRRRRDPAYRLQLKADREVALRIPAARRRMLETIAGNSSNRENRLLAHLAMQAPRGGCIVEIGALFGKSTAWLVEAAHLRAEPLKVVSIDPHLCGTWNAYCETVSRFRLAERGLEVRREESHAAARAWSRPIALLWIDGSHEYADVLNDIDDFTPHVMLGARIVFDDASGKVYSGVARAIDEKMHANPEFAFLGMIKNFAIFERHRPASGPCRTEGRNFSPAAEFEASTTFPVQARTG